MNRWNIPAWLEQRVIERDKTCVYCGVDFSFAEASRGMRPSWEHIVNDASLVTLDNIARCCISCNASKGAKDLLNWLESAYCKRKGISDSSVTQVVQNAIAQIRAQRVSL